MPISDSESGFHLGSRKVSLSVCVRYILHYVGIMNQREEDELVVIKSQETVKSEKR